MSDTDNDDLEAHIYIYIYTCTDTVIRQIVVFFRRLQYGLGDHRSSSQNQLQIGMHLQVGNDDVISDIADA